MESEFPDAYKAVLRFAAERHGSQKEKGTGLPYLLHLAAVSSEVMIACMNRPDLDLQFALTVSLLHDILEDTKTKVEELTSAFGVKVSDAVQALTKSSLEKDKELRLLDSLARIQSQPVEVWLVKLADRITNLDAPALPWPEEKRRAYMKGSVLILEHLQEADSYLAGRLKAKITDYTSYVVSGATGPCKP